MTRQSERVSPDPYRKARFREIARGIVAKDRYNRKYGIAVDTAGAIAGALERAYRDGVQGGQNAPAPRLEHPNSGPIEWVLIPPRPRDAFWSICLFTLSRGDRPASAGQLVPCVTERGTAGWKLIVHGQSYEKAMGDRTINPLIRLGLLEVAPDDPEHRVVSKRGEETWSLFLQRGGQYPEDLTDL